LTGTVTPQAGNEAPLAAGTPVVAGGGDQSSQAVGVGAISPQVGALTLGTSGVVFAPLAEYRFEPQGRLHAFCHAAPGQWHMMGVMLSAAGALQWFRDQFAPGLPFAKLLEEAAPVPPGSDGLLFLPYLSGERTPHPDPLARGAFVGLTARHTRGHLTRAVLEGVAFGLRDSLELIKSAGATPRTLRASGGGARSPLWRQILADTLVARLATVNSVEGAALGAAVLAAVGAGAFANVVEACAQLVREVEQVEPGTAAETYHHFYLRYQALYPALRSEFHALARLAGAS
jgi:xylulokinase